MSRRKQSHPKPLKQGEKDVAVLSKDICLPEDVLRLHTSGLRDDVIGPDLVLMSKTTLPARLTFGPFCGHLTNKGTIDGENTKSIVEVFDSSSQKVLIAVESKEGQWMKYIHTSSLEDDSNAVITAKDNQIWCQLVKDIAENQRLVAMYDSTQCPTNTSPTKDTTQHSTSDKDNQEMRDEYTEHRVIVKKPMNTHNQKACHPLIYRCQFCGVRYSNLSTLQAHQQYYCTKNSNQETEENNDSTIKETKSPLSSPTHITSKRPSEKDDDSRAVSPPLKKLKVKVEIQSPLPSPASQKIMTSPQISPVGKADNLSTPTTLITKPSLCLPALAPAIQNNFCSDCSINFTSSKTFLAHKQYYCSNRRREKENLAPQKELPSMVNGSVHHPAFSMSHVPLVLNTPGAMLNSSSALLPGQATVVFTTPVMTPDGSQVTLAVPTVIMQPVIQVRETPGEQEKKTVNKEQPKIHVPLLDGSSEAHRPVVSKLSVEDENDQPLDLSIKKKNNNEQSIYVHNKEAHFNPDEPQDLTMKSIDNTSRPPSVDSQKDDRYVNRESNIHKCPKCNIIFYQYANYMIHKDHYCSARGCVSRPLPNIVNRRRSTPPGESRDQSNDNNTKDDEIDHESILRFACVPCKIKFSSLKTLNAHKKYYCPSRENVGPEVIKELRKPTIQVACANCNALFLHPDGLKNHVCPSKSPPLNMAALRCQLCDYISPSENRLVEHTKLHAPSKVYKCNICGYRGNTVRGMRMHGRLHIDEGDEFTDDNIAEFEEAAVLPVHMSTDSTMNAMNDDVFTSSPSEDDELIRLKNAPYKRRRSRKCYEKIEHMSPTARSQTEASRKSAPHKCGICHLPFPDTLSLREHTRTHSKDPGVFKCRSCDFLADCKSSMVYHVKMFHEQGFSLRDDDDSDVTEKCDVTVKEEPIPVSEKTGDIPQSDDDIKQKSNLIKVRSTDDNSDGEQTAKPITIKTEVPDYEEIIPKEEQTENEDDEIEAKADEPLQSDVQNNNSVKHGHKYCRFCNISFNYLSTFIAHKKYYCNQIANNTDPADSSTEV